MTPASQMQAAIDILDQWIEGVPIERALTNWARSARYAGSRDRAAVRDYAFDILRNKGRAACLGGGETGRALMLGYARLRELPLERFFTGSGYAPTPLTPAEENILRRDTGAISPFFDYPDWISTELRADLGPDAAAFAAEQGERAPLFLRVNLSRCTRLEARKALRESEISTEECPSVRTALRVIDGGRRLRQAPAYRDGLVEPQDLAIQAALGSINWPTGGRILDYCAGGGGKSLALADQTDCAIFAHDANKKRMADIEPRALRAGVMITPLTFDGVSSEQSFDAVLCDVPCSGSGTWRRTPEAKWRLSRAELDRLIATQADILRHARELVKPTGRLIYMTCSVFQRENNNQVAAFLAENPCWRLSDAQLNLGRNGSDGFYHAVLEGPGR